MVVSPGMVLDTAITSLIDAGLDVSKPGLQKHSVHRTTVLEAEANATRKIICAINGLESVRSYFDGFLDENNVISGSSYFMKGGKIKRHDFTLTARTRRSPSGYRLYDPNEVPLPGFNISGPSVLADRSENPDSGRLK